GGDGSNTNGTATATAGGGKLDAGGAPNPASGGLLYDRVTSGDKGKGGHGGRGKNADNSVGFGGGGGGGGYWGGAGGTTVTQSSVSGGGGGSSWAQTEDGALKFTGIIPSPAVPGGGSYEGHGKVQITLVSATE
ncbi:MAG: hypothetical protein LBJ35_03035, partial [Spirochaetaceae bacterium]|nr:hypothetical protein [Spirochaetaceae bacterium]